MFVSQPAFIVNAPAGANCELLGTLLGIKDILIYQITQGKRLPRKHTLVLRYSCLFCGHTKN